MNADGALVLVEAATKALGLFCFVGALVLAGIIIARTRR